MPRCRPTLVSLYRCLQRLVSWVALDPIKLTVRTNITPSKCMVLSCVLRTLSTRKNKLWGEVCSLLLYLKVLCQLKQVTRMMSDQCRPGTA